MTTETNKIDITDDRAAEKFRRVVGLPPNVKVRRSCLRCGKRFVSANRTKQYMCFECRGSIKRGVTDCG